MTPSGCVRGRSVTPRSREEKVLYTLLFVVLATRIYLRKEGTGVEHTETRGLTPQEATRHTPLFRMVIQERYLLRYAASTSIT